VAGEDVSLVGLKIKAPTDVYTANYTTISGSLWESGTGEKNSGLALSGSMSEVIVENSRTNDAFSAMLLATVTQSDQAGLVLPSVGGSVATLYGRFPRHYRDFLENEEHRNEIYETLKGDSQVTFGNFIGSYARIESAYWRGEGGGIGKGKGISWGKRTETTLQFQPISGIRLIPGEETLARRREEFYRFLAVGNSSGWAHVWNKLHPPPPGDPWLDTLQSQREKIEAEYQRFWGAKNK